MALVWTYDTAAHLLLRAGFGHNGSFSKKNGDATQVRALANLTPDKAVDRLLKIPLSKARGPTDDFLKLQRWWFDKMRTSKPLREKMVLFLHTHFATAKTKVDRPLYMAKQNALFREFAIGDFRALVKRINVDPAMLWWLDGQDNTAGAPNENYARELMQLFTLGPEDFAGAHNYSQDDVTQVARILTGWYNVETKTDVVGQFDANRHDTGSPTAKTVFARNLTPPQETPNQALSNFFTVTDQGALEHEFLVDKLFAHTDTENRPTAARFITRKLWKFFAYDPDVDDNGGARADLPLIDDLADTFVANNYSLAAVLKAMFLREEFYADATRTVKGPVEYVVGSLRMLKGKVSKTRKETLVGDSMPNMGQEILDPPSVFSWRGNLSWITTQTLLTRYAFARDLAAGEKTTKFDLGFNVFTYFKPEPVDRQFIIDRLLHVLGPLTIDATSNAELLAWLGTADPVDLSNDDFVTRRVRPLVNLILSLPQYLVH